MCILKRRIFFVAVSCISFLVCGCSKAPDKELAEAKAAIEAAKEVEADIYMSRNFENLENALKTAQEDIAVENAKFILNRKYKRITEVLKKTTELALEIKNDAPKVKAEIIAQVEENLGLVKGMLEETANDIKKGSRGKDKALIEELKADLNGGDSAATLAAKEYDSGNVLGASGNLDEVQRLIKKITDTLKPPKSDE